MAVKIIIFCFIIITVKVMFSLLFQVEDKKLNMMKESSDFIEFLRIYSCIMKMPFEEILSNYSFKHENVKSVFDKLFLNIKTGKASLDEKEVVNDKNFDAFVKEQIGSESEFNLKLNKIAEFYGSSMSDILDNKLSFLKSDIDKYICEYEIEYKDRKKLFNKLSFFIGSLIAIVLM